MGLGELCRIAARLLTRAYAEAAPGTRAGLILFVQTFGDLVGSFSRRAMSSAAGTTRSWSRRSTRLRLRTDVRNSRAHEDRADKDSRLNLFTHLFYTPFFTHLYTIDWRVMYADARFTGRDWRINALVMGRNPPRAAPVVEQITIEESQMNSCLKYFSATLLALLTQAAFAQVPQLGAAASFAVLSAAPDGGGAVTCTDSTIDGDVGSSGARASVVTTRCRISGAVIAPVSAQVVDDFNSAYADLKALEPCTETFTETSLGDHIFTPGVYCFTSAVTETNAVWTLKGGSNDLWIFKIGTQAAGALTGTNFSVVMEGGDACDVYWWVDAAATMTDSDFKGTILAGAAITDTGGTFEGSALAKAAVTLTGAALVGCEGGSRGGRSRSTCNQGVGNGPEACDPGNSNQDGHGSNPFVDAGNTNDELGGTPGKPGRKGGNIK